MSVTIIAAVMVMVAYFLVLYGGVGFIQDKKFFSSAPKEVLDAVPDHKERFPGAHVIGWIIAGIAVLLFAGAAVLSILDGIRNGFSFCMSWKFMIYASLTGFFFVIPISSRTFIRKWMASWDRICLAIIKRRISCILLFISRSAL